MRALTILWIGAAAVPLTWAGFLAYSGDTAERIVDGVWTPDWFSPAFLLLAAPGPLAAAMLAGAGALALLRGRHRVDGRGAAALWWAVVCAVALVLAAGLPADFRPGETTGRADMALWTLGQFGLAAGFPLWLPVTGPWLCAILFAAAGPPWRPWLHLATAAFCGLVMTVGAVVALAAAHLA